MQVLRKIELEIAFGRKVLEMDVLAATRVRHLLIPRRTLEIGIVEVVGKVRNARFHPALVIRSGERGARTPIAPHGAKRHRAIAASRGADRCAKLLGVGKRLPSDAVRGSAETAP